jgi:hypothetical protein
MSKVWDRVVEDLQSYTTTEKQNKSFWQKIKEFFNNSCTGECNQGRSPCNCAKMINHDNRY